MAEQVGDDRRVVFWDFDGTLARRDGLFSGALVDAARRVDPTLELERDDLKRHLIRGFPWHTPEAVREPISAEAWWNALSDVFIAAYINCGVDPAAASAASDLVSGEFYRVEAWAMIDGSLQALAMTAATGYRNVILSNHGPQLPELVSSLGIGRYVDLTITSAALGVEKPNPMIFTRAVELADAGSDVWMVGDNPIADVAGAEAVGIRAILADGDYPDSRGMTVLEAAQRICAQG